jgi:hypothetical protein
VDGPTDLDNMILRCPFHHRPFEAVGWTVHLIKGTAWWRPPTWYDPNQHLRRNTTHHPTDLTFRQPDVA